MAESTPSSLPDPPPPLSSTMKENRAEVGSTLADLDKSQSELVERIRRLKEDMQGWRMKLDTQVKSYKDEISQLKSSLNSELEQLKSEFKDLRVTLKQQQDDVANSLKSLGMEDLAKGSENPENPKGNVEDVEVKTETVVEAATVESGKEDTKET